MQAQADDSRTTIADLKARVAAFVRERDWEQFHSPKNLSMALAVEAAELMELFQWKTEQESWQVKDVPDQLGKVREELADIAIFVLNLANRLDVDLAGAVTDKLSTNALKYPVEKARGSAQKYTAYYIVPLQGRGGAGDCSRPYRHRLVSSTPRRRTAQHRQLLDADAMEPPSLATRGLLLLPSQSSLPTDRRGRKVRGL